MAIHFIDQTMDVNFIADAVLACAFEPTRIYLGRREMSKLRALARASGTHAVRLSAKGKFNKFMGLWVYEVDEERHLYLARVEEDVA